VDPRIEISGFSGNCLVFKEKFSAKLLTFKFNKMTFFLRHFVLNMFSEYKPAIRWTHPIFLIVRLGSIMSTNSA
jgi:hypothetical protein